MKIPLFLAILFFLGRPLAAQEWQRYVFTAPKMGTPFRIVLYARDSIAAAAAVQRAFDRVDSLNRIMSDYAPDSEINKLADRAENDPKAYYPVSKDLWRLLKYAQKVSRRSKGAFDITVGPLTQLWRRAFRRQTFPDPTAIEEARSLVNYRRLKLRNKDQSARLAKSGMRLDLGGIAKGYAVDAAYAVLKKEGFLRALVDGGGDIYAGEPPPGETGWRISRTVLREGTLQNEIAYLKNGAVATSGDTYRFLTWEGKRYSHLVDPRTGLGTTDRRQVTVHADNCTTADALASALSIIDLDKTRPTALQFGAAFRIIVEWADGSWHQLEEIQSDFFTRGNP